MNAPFTLAVEPTGLHGRLDTMRKAWVAAPPPSLAARLADLDALRRWIVDEEEAILAAISADFGNRSRVESRFSEILVVLSSIRNTKSQLRSWMRPRRRRADPVSFPFARNRVVPQPLGVVGVISPWNFPLQLSFNPLVSAFAAGNSAMLKMSEFSRGLAKLLIRTAPKYFPAEKLQIFDDDGTLGPSFSALPFDHLVFTGSSQTGRAVMQSAARNLTPVTLELGGKSPAVVAPDFSLQTAAERILWAKLFNAGQICVNVDYCFVPEGQEEAFTDIARKLVARRYPDLNGADYTSIVNERNFLRLEGLLEDARGKGAKIVNLAAGQTPDRAQRKFAPTIVLGATPDMKVAQEEIFGPILPVYGYSDKQQVADYINARERPLALYPFSRDSAFVEFFVDRVMSGGVSVNDAMLHFAQADMPLGGVGASGVGQYQAREGFDRLSKLRPVFAQGPATPVQWLFQPPYGAIARRLLDVLIRLKT